MSGRRVAVIGNGKMAVDCIKIVRTTPGLELTVAVTEPKAVSPANALPAYCAKEGIRVHETERVNGAEAVSALRDCAPDVILNINSFKILRPAVLSIPPDGVINFHNGPLPRYGGVNVCSWAIINGETRHGVTWHYVDEGIDTGAIVAQRCFDLSANETAVSLIMKCISVGTALFREWVPRLADGRLPATVQDASNATYFSLKDLPNNGAISFEWSFAELDRFVRGLSFHPIANTFVHPRGGCNGRTFFVQSVERIADASAVDFGRVVEIGPDYVGVQINGSTVALKDFLDEDKNPIAVDALVKSYGVAVGTYLGG